MFGLVLYEIMTLKALPDWDWPHVMKHCCPVSGTPAADPCNRLKAVLQERSKAEAPHFIPGAAAEEPSWCVVATSASSSSMLYPALTNMTTSAGLCTACWPCGGPGTLNTSQADPAESLLESLLQPHSRI